jgi:hypothetical protein
MTDPTAARARRPGPARPRGVVATVTPSPAAPGRLELLARRGQARKRAWDEITWHQGVRPAGVGAVLAP